MLSWLQLGYVDAQPTLVFNLRHQHFCSQGSPVPFPQRISINVISLQYCTNTLFKDKHLGRIFKSPYEIILWGFYISILK